MAQNDRHESRPPGAGGGEERTRGRGEEDRRARYGSAPDQEWRGGYGETGTGEPPRYMGSQPGYGAHAMGYGPQGGSQGGAWGVYGVPRDVAHEYATDARSGPPQSFDQPHGRMPYGWSGSFGSAGEHGSRAESTAPREQTGQHAFDERASGAGAADRHISSGEARRRGPKGYQRSDERIGEIIYERLMEAHGIDPSDVTIEVKDGVVTLHGSVAHRQMKYWIEDIAADTFGVKDVENKLRVALTAPWPTTSGRGVR